MRHLFKALLIALALLPLGLRPASAQVGELFVELMVNCREDARDFCADVEPGGGRIAACLYSRLNDLSPRCHRSMRDGIALRACAADYDRYCRDVPLGEGRVAACLLEFRDEISPRCLDALAMAGRGGGRYGRYEASPKYAEPYSRKRHDRLGAEDEGGDDHLK
jgi:Golgi apparatus protein 1